MKVDELRALKPADLAKQLDEAQQELLNLRFRLSTKQLVNHREYPMVKKQIARLMTVIREKELGIK